MQSEICRSSIFLLLCLILEGALAAPLPSSIYHGMCDASAAVALDENHFAVASDEDSVIRVYNKEIPGLPLKSFDFSAFLALGGDKPETDIEGGARLGDLVFWISSHGRNKKGKERANRHRLFVTRIKTGGAIPDLVSEGHPYTRLLSDLSRAPFAKVYGLTAAMSEAPKEKGGFNIEGLAATPEGQLLIGLRNPIPHGKALIIPLLNPLAILEGKASAKFGQPIELNLAGMGIRDIALFGKEYLIVAGDYNNHQGSRIYRWAGGAAVPKLMDATFKHFNPEALVAYSGSQTDFQVLSDDGSRKVGEIECKRLPLLQRTFRAIWVNVE